MSKAHTDTDAEDYGREIIRPCDRSPELDSMADKRRERVPVPVASFRLFIGLHDRNGRPCDPGAVADAFALLTHAHESYTRTDARGVWQGAEEPTAIVEIIAPDTDASREQLRATARTLASILDQECIGLSIAPLDTFELIP